MPSQSSSPSPEKGVAHTPGPWVFKPEDRIVSYVKGVPLIIADRCGADFIMGTKEWVANARLIAAAPDMLNELQEVLGWIQHWQRDLDDELPPTRSSLDEREASIRAAIARATEGV